jgi:uncharacterized protein (DUF2267 family)
MKIGIPVLEAALRDAQGWVVAAGQRINTRSSPVAFASLRATLHALRAQLDMRRAIEVGERLPLVMRAVFFDGWDPHDVPPPAASKDQFVRRVAADNGRTPRIKAERAAKAALEVIFERLPAAVAARVVERLPEDLRELWPDEPAPYVDLRRSTPLPPDLDATRKSRTSPSRLRRATRRGPGEINVNALPERKGRPRRRSAP